MGAVFAARQVEHLLTDDRSRNAIDVAERYAHGNATKDELDAAARAANAAANAAADAAAYAAARAAYAAAYAAADAAARAVYAAADAAADESIAKWYRENTKPNFRKGGA